MLQGTPEKCTAPRSKKRMMAVMLADIKKRFRPEFPRGSASGGEQQVEGVDFNRYLS